MFSIRIFFLLFASVFYCGGKTFERPFVELFVMSECPYAVEAEKHLIPVLKKLGESVEFRLFFISDYIYKVDIPSSDMNVNIDSYSSDGKCVEIPEESGKSRENYLGFTSLHGVSEVRENIIQVLIAQNYPDRLYDYLINRSLMTSEINWKKVASSAGFPDSVIARLEYLKRDTSQVKKLLRKNIEPAKRRRVRASPTIYLNGSEYSGLIDSAALGREICRYAKSEYCERFGDCMTDFDCISKGVEGYCREPGTKNSECIYEKHFRFKIFLINKKSCSLCRPHRALEMIKAKFPGSELIELSISDSAAKSLIERHSIRAFPAVLFESKADSLYKFRQIKHTFRSSGDKYILKEGIIKVRFFNKRLCKPGRLDLLISPYVPASVETVRLLEDQAKALMETGRFGLYYIFSDDSGAYSFARIVSDLQIKEHFPGKYYDFLLCSGFEFQKLYSGGLRDSIPELSLCAEQTGIENYKTAIQNNKIEASKLNNSFIGEILPLKGTVSYLINNRLLIETDYALNSKLKGIILNELKKGCEK
ncbi:MAG: hypothetical protein ACLFQK_05980 [Fibrobacterota bacterium]